ncbi:MAG TPA: CCA tRNA nucleotidyltransferase [Gemmatimonadales bacterium]
MDERFPLTDVPRSVQEIADRLIEAGHEAWFVGGAVRDALIRAQLGRDVRQGDFDIATSARPEAVVALFRRTVPVGIEHGTVAVVDDDNRAHEVTTFRRDVRTDGRHAEVEFGVSLDDDLARRDFTINAIAVHPRSGEIRDPFKGRGDLDAGLIRAVGDPVARFREDRLRVLRGLRFSAVYGFTIEPRTLEALRAATTELEHLSRERVRDEWVKMLSRSVPSTAIRLWRDAGALASVWPELAGLNDASIDALDEVEPRDPILVTAIALSGTEAGSQGAFRIAVRMKLSVAERNRMSDVIFAASRPAPDPEDARTVRHWLEQNRGDPGDVVAGAPVGAAQRVRLRKAVDAVLASGAPLSVKQLAVDGNDLQQAGFPSGPRIGQILRALLLAVLDDPALNTRDSLLALAGKIPA